MKTLKRLAASSLLTLALVAGTVSSALADIIINEYECTLVSTTIAWENGTITDTYRCKLLRATIIYE